MTRKIREARIFSIFGIVTLIGISIGIVMVDINLFMYFPIFWFISFVAVDIAVRRQGKRQTRE